MTPQCAAAAAAAAIFFASGVHAQHYPSKPVRLVVPFAAGSATDTMGRTFGQKLTEILSQPIVVDNKPGANGIIGADAVAKASADGYTILLGTSSTHAAVKSLYKKLPYDLERDFAPIAFLGSVPLMVTVNNDLPVKTLGELIAMAKARPDYVTFAGASTSQRVATEMLAGMAGLKMIYVPYKSAPNAITDVMSGQVMMFTADIALMLPQVRAGKVRALAVTSSKRSAMVPDLPTVSEAGNLKGYELIGWFGAFAPAATPKEIVAKLNDAFNKATESTEVKARLAALGIESSPGGTPEALAAYAKAETAKWAKAIRDAGIEPE